MKIKYTISKLVQENTEWWKTSNPKEKKKAKKEEKNEDRITEANSTKQEGRFKPKYISRHIKYKGIECFS